MKRFTAWIATLGVSVVAATGCGSEKAASPGTKGLPAPVEQTRSAILAAAEGGDYDDLRALLEPNVFLSDFGFGISDPVERWEELGAKPLQTMGALVRMSHSIRKTNEGTLYQWPSYDPDSTAGDLSAEDRKLFLTIMSQDDLANAFNPDYGYTAPRLGILDDGTWWFFIREAGP